jgi:hypothetical protein
VIVVTASVDAPTTFNVPPSEAAAPTMRDPPVTTNPPVIVVTASVDAPTTFNEPVIVLLFNTIFVLLILAFASVTLIIPVVVVPIVVSPLALNELGFA